QPHDGGSGNRGDERVRLLGIAHHVLLSLQGDPRLVQLTTRAEYVIALTVATVGEPGARTQARSPEVLIPAEAQAQCPGESTRGSLSERGIDECRAGGVSDEHGHE